MKWIKYKGLMINLANVYKIIALPDGLHFHTIGSQTSIVIPCIQKHDSALLLNNVNSFIEELDQTLDLT